MHVRHPVAWLIFAGYCPEKSLIIRDVFAAVERDLQDKASQDLLFPSIERSLMSLNSNKQAFYRVAQMYSTEDALSCRSIFAKEPLIIGLFWRKRPIKLRHSIGLRHSVTFQISDVSIPSAVDAVSESLFRSLISLWQFPLTMLLTSRANVAQLIRARDC